MNEKNRVELFEQALSYLQAGKSLEEVYSILPLDEELREMVQLSHKMQYSADIQPVPTRQQRSRSAFLQSAAQQPQTKKGAALWHWLTGMRLAAQLTILALLILGSLTVTGLVSAQSLPGEPLYGVKRTVEQMQIALTRDSSGRVQLEEVLDARRVDEVKRLMAAERWQPVTFAGWLQYDPDSGWFVQDIPVFSEQLPQQWNILLAGSYVQVNGMLLPEGVLVKDIQLRLFELHGTLSRDSEDNWTLNGLPVEISPQTQGADNLQENKRVSVTAIRLQNDGFLALVIRSMDNASKDGQSSGETVTSVRETTPTFTNTATSQPVLPPLPSATLDDSDDRDGDHDVDDDKADSDDDSEPDEEFDDAGDDDSSDDSSDDSDDDSDDDDDNGSDD